MRGVLPAGLLKQSLEPQRETLPNSRPPQSDGLFNGINLTYLVFLKMLVLQLLLCI